MQAGELIDPGGRVLALLTAYGHGRGSSVETDGKFAHLWTMRDGKATQIEGYTDCETARSDAGLKA